MALVAIELMIGAGFDDSAPLSLSYIRPRGGDLGARRNFR